MSLRPSLKSTQRYGNFYSYQYWSQTHPVDSQLKLCLHTKTETCSCIIFIRFLKTHMCLVLFLQISTIWEMSLHLNTLTNNVLTKDYISHLVISSWSFNSHSLYRSGTSNQTLTRRLFQLTVRWFSSSSRTNPRLLFCKKQPHVICHRWVLS